MLASRFNCETVVGERGRCTFDEHMKSQKHVYYNLTLLSVRQIIVQYYFSVALVLWCCPIKHG